MGSSPIYGICRAGNFPEVLGTAIEADWSRCSFASVSQIAAVAAVQIASSHIGMRQSAIPSPSADTYVSRIGYYETVGIPHLENFTRRSANDRFMPLAIIEEHRTNDVAAGLRKTVTSHLPFSASATDMMDYAFGEVVDNVLQHSKSFSPGLACSQFYPTGNYVEVCIADCGVGIAKSMADNPAYSGLSPDGLMAKAFEQGAGQYVGVPSFGSDRVSLGMGLWTAANVVRVLGGNIWAVSKSCGIDVSESGTFPVNGLYFPGTLICMRFPVTDTEVSERDVLGTGSDLPVRWSPSDGWHYDGEDDDILW